MSETMIGADYASLDALITEYTTKGESLKSAAMALQQRMTSTVTVFRDTSQALRSEVTRTRAAYESGPLQSIAAKASSVQWNGNNRMAFDASFSTTKNNVLASLTNLEEGLTKIVSAVDSHLNSSLETAAAQVSSMGEGMQADAKVFSQDVTTQVENLRAADAGWA
jgi:hypothetical protein